MSWHCDALALGQGFVELLAVEEAVGDAEVAVHDRDVGGGKGERASTGATREGVEASAEVFVVGDEVTGLLVGGGA